MTDTAIVTGASRGLGRAVAAALAATGAHVLGIARGAAELEAAAGQDGFTPVTGDGTDPDLARDLLAEHRPRTVVLAAGALPPMGPLTAQTWESLSVPWHADVRHVFEWTRAALLLPLPPGSRLVAFSSGAAVKGSPLSGGYAGAKATVRFLTAYAAAEAAPLGITVGCVLPGMNPAGGVGRTGLAAYGGTPPPAPTAAQVAATVLTVADRGGAWLLTPDGPTPA
jgi:NAD(P)-dependent dehydrogenase (short-subunit alcohol dehydrogenase family)